LLIHPRVNPWCSVFDRIDKVDHNLGYSSPLQTYDKYLPLITKSIKTYEPIVRVLSDNASDQHVIAKKTRLAELMLEMGNYSLAIHYADEGLAVDPNNATLKTLRGKAANKLKVQ